MELLNKHNKFYCFLNMNNPMVLWETHIGRISSADASPIEGFNPLSLRYASSLYDLSKINCSQYKETS